MTLPSTANKDFPQKQQKLQRVLSLKSNVGNIMPILYTAQFLIPYYDPVLYDQALIA